MIKATAPAKIILLGEHAVVYGSPAIAIPIHDLQATAEVKPMQDDFNLQLVNTHENLTLADKDNPFIQLLVSTFDVLSIPIPKICISVTSDIPIASGLGSGAAISTAIVKCIYSYFFLDYDYTKINSIVYDSEKHYHGTPSGIDNTVIVYEKPIYFVKEKEIKTLKLQNVRLIFLVGNTGQSASTKNSVSNVKSLYEKDRKTTQGIFDRISEITHAAKIAILGNDAKILGSLMNENHRLLQELAVSSEKLDTLVQAARNAGAYGAKLSGGGRGGNMIALIPENKVDEIKKALLRAGATNVYQTTLE